MVYGCPPPECEEEILPIEEGAWTVKASMYTARAYPAVVTVDDKIYVIGGKINKDQATGAVEMYDPETDTWNVKASMPTARCALGAAEVDGKIYCIGGSVQIPTASADKFNVVEIYDPETDSWETGTPMPTLRSNFPASELNGKIYCYGGFGISRTPPEVDVYDPATDSWSQAADMPMAKNSCARVTMNNKIIALLGEDGGDDLRVSSVSEYDPETDTWTTDLLQLSYDGMLHYRAALHEGIIYLFGGLNWNMGENEEFFFQSPETIYSYTPGMDSLVNTEVLLPYVGWGGVVTITGNTLYFIGGERLEPNVGATGDISAAVYGMDLVYDPCPE